jgi:acyl carrier protein
VADIKSECLADLLRNTQSGLAAKDVQGWESFKQIEIIMAAEEKFGIKMTTRELDSLQNVGDLVRIVLAKGT